MINRMSQEKIRRGLGNVHYDDLNKLIDKGDEVDSARLRVALKSNEITPEQYSLLADKLLRRHELVQERLIIEDKKQGAQIEGLGIDPVTKLFKHDSLMQKLGELTQELNFKSISEKSRRPPLYAVVLMAIDLDNLKIWNDYGHNIGDEALLIIANSLRKTTKDKDYKFRRGDKSDEIEVAIRVENDLTDEEITELIFKRIQREINTGSIETKDGKLPVTAALGYVILRPGESRTVEDILAAADANQVADKNPEVKKHRIEKAKADLNRN